MTLTGNILITGGSGTLGQAIISRAEREGWPCTFTVYSRSELNQAQMRAKFPHVRYILGDIRDRDRLTAAVAGHDIVIHAAAMKRIPECEAQPSECYQTNIQGSLNVIHACQINTVQRCLGISTDKACRAITAYGASKLAMEKAFQTAGHLSSILGGATIFSLVRYGNVLASQGSVLPLWQQQIANGEPITVTDPAMTRFWMSIDQAIDLILMGLTAAHGEIWIAKMKALNILDMARFALGLEGDIRHIEIGLRSDEKLHEDLIHRDELIADRGSYFVITPVGTRGLSYRSDRVPQLSRDELRAMLDLPILEAA